MKRTAAVALAVLMLVGMLGLLIGCSGGGGRIPDGVYELYSGVSGCKKITVAGSKMTLHDSVTMQFEYKIDGKEIILTSDIYGTWIKEYEWIGDGRFSCNWNKYAKK